MRIPLTCTSAVGLLAFIAVGCPDNSSGGPEDGGGGGELRATDATEADGASDGSEQRDDVDGGDGGASDTTATDLDVEPTNDAEEVGEPIDLDARPPAVEAVACERGGTREAVRVEIDDDHAVSDKEVEIGKGDVVKWYNASSNVEGHGVRSGRGPSAEEAGRAFDSGRKGIEFTGDVFCVKFREERVYDWFCPVHPESETGTIVVGDATRTTDVWETDADAEEADVEETGGDGEAIDGTDEDATGDTGPAPFPEVGDSCSSDADCGVGVCQKGTRPNGYCTRRCGGDAICGAEGHCGLFGDETYGTCLKTCQSDADCSRSGYACQYADEDRLSSLKECAPVGQGTSGVGEPCSTTADCKHGKKGRCLGESEGYRNGYCVHRDCTEDGDCPSGTECIDGTATDPGLCFDRCQSDSDCRTAGYACIDMDDDGDGECHPAGTGSKGVGEACSGIWECGGGERAECRRSENFPGGYCTLDCASSSCPDGTECTSWGYEEICAPNCESDADCPRSGYACVDEDGSGSKECVPTATGGGGVGDSCDVVQDCSGGKWGQCVDDPNHPGGYCSRDCQSADTCQANSHCGVNSDCLQSCSSDGDCRPGYDCYDEDLDTTRECAPVGDGTRPVGASCQSVRDCGLGQHARCLDWRGGYCTRPCGSDYPPCPDGSSCSEDWNVCMEDCSSDSDCRRQYHCLYDLCTRPF